MDTQETDAEIWERELELIKKNPEGALQMIKLRNAQLVEAEYRIAQLEKD